jgi:hypothetical protein
VRARDKVRTYTRNATGLSPGGAQQQAISAKRK